jgi:hypothetical protein
MMTKKGQVALEAAFVVLFISIAIGGIIMKTTVYTRHAEIMSSSRAIAQQVAFELTMEGIKTHLVRIDPIDLEKGAVQVYILSEKCLDAETALKDPNALGTDVFVTCKSDFYLDKKFPQP